VACEMRRANKSRMQRGLNRLARMSRGGRVSRNARARSKGNTTQSDDAPVVPRFSIILLFVFESLIRRDDARRHEISPSSTPNLSAMFARTVASRLALLDEKVVACCRVIICGGRVKSKFDTQSIIDTQLEANILHNDSVINRDLRDGDSSREAE